MIEKGQYIRVKDIFVQKNDTQEKWWKDFEQTNIMKRWESLIFFQCIFYWKKRFSPKTLLTWHFPKKYFAVQVSRTLNSNCAAGTMKVDDRPELPPVQRAHIFYLQPRSYWKYLFFFFQPYYWGPIIFPVQFSIASGCM